MLQTALRAPNVLQNLLGEQTLSASFIPVYSRLLAQGRHGGRPPLRGRRVRSAGGGRRRARARRRPAGPPPGRGLRRRLPGGRGEGRRRRARGRPLRAGGRGRALDVPDDRAAGALGVGARGAQQPPPVPALLRAPVAWNGAIVAALALAAAAPGRAAHRARRTRPPAARGLRRRADRRRAAVPGPVARQRCAPSAWLRPPLAGDSGRARGARRVRAGGGRDAAWSSSPRISTQLLASLLAVGAVSALGYAQLLYLLPVSLFGLSVAAASLPDMARRGGSDDRAGLADRGPRDALAQSGFLNLPSTVAYLTPGMADRGRSLSPRSAAASAARRACWSGWCWPPTRSGCPRRLDRACCRRPSSRSVTPGLRPGSPALRVAVGVALGAPLMLLLDRWAVADLPGSAGPSRLRMGAVGLALAASAAAWLERAALRRAPGAPAARAASGPGASCAVMLVAAVAAAVPGFLAWRARGRPRPPSVARRRSRPGSVSRRPTAGSRWHSACLRSSRSRGRWPLGRR